MTVGPYTVTKKNKAQITLTLQWYACCCAAGVCMAFELASHKGLFSEPRLRRPNAAAHKLTAMLCVSVCLFYRMDETASVQLEVQIKLGKVSEK